MEIRRARPTDAHDLDELALGCGLKLDSARELALEHSELWLCVKATQPVGLALGWFVADELEIVDVAVHETRRRLGWGGLLLDRLLTRGRERGAKRAFLEVRAGNLPAQALYAAHGFFRDGERRAYYADGEDAWLFRCCLGAATGTESP